nr:hypothetical protein [Tanacetum cinerariifolium]
MSDSEALNEQLAKLSRALKLLERRILSGQYNCSCCGGPRNDGNRPGCRIVGTGNGFVYDQNPYSYNETPNFFNQPSQHSIETYSCENCRGSPHMGFDCQIGNTPNYDQDPWNTYIYDHGPCYNKSFSDDQPSFYSSYQQQQFDCCEVCGGPHYSPDCQTRNQLVYKPSPGEHLDTLSTKDREIDFNPIRDIEELERLLANHVPVLRVFDEPLGNSDSISRSFDETFSNPLFDFNDDFTLCNDNPLFDEEFEDISSLDPFESTLVIDESTLLVTLLLDPRQICLKEVERFDHFFSLTQSEGTTRVMETPSFGFHHMSSPCPTAYTPTEVMHCYYCPHLTSGEHLDTLSTKDREIDFNPIRDIEELERLLANHVPVLRVFDEPLGNSDSISRSFDETFSNPLFDFNDDFTLCNDNPLFDEEFEDISSLDPFESTLVIDESTLLVTLLLDPRQICLKEVERFDHFFSLTQSEGTTRVMETPSFGFHHMSSPCPTAYTPTEVMHCYYCPHLTSGDGFDHGPKMK